MAKTKKKEATAQVHTGRAQAQASIIAEICQLPEADIALEMPIFNNGNQTEAFESDTDCGYIGGVNCSPDSDSELSGSSWSDTETLAELDGEELEENL